LERKGQVWGWSGERTGLPLRGVSKIFDLGRGVRKMLIQEGIRASVK
jgi:hypothetical protein